MVFSSCYYLVGNLNMIKNKDQLIKNGATQELKKLRADVIQILEAALESVDPIKAILQKIKIEDFMLKVNNLTLSLKGIRKIIVIGGGKAGGSMAVAIEELLGERITEGLINVLKETEDLYRIPNIKLHGAAHPIPDEGGLSGVKEMLKLIESLSYNDLVIILISGGGSAMMPLPAEGISLSNLQDITYRLLQSGATINEINAVRKHLSAFKGGQLAKECYPAQVLSLILSDVVGDPLDTIASGPTTPDETTFKTAKEVLEKYCILENASLGIKERLQLGCNGEIPDTPKENDPIFRNVHNFIVANNATAALAASEKAEELGYISQVLSTFIEGEAKEVGNVYSSIIREISKSGRPVKPPCAIIIGGETTVTVKGRGKGGRNQELALSSLRKLNGINCVLATLGTDGIDGGTDAAGAIVDGMSYKRGEKKQQKIEELLKDNNSNKFFKSLKDLIITGPTGTNVNDLTVILVR
jgi:glycerate-2-kinase